MRMDTTPAVTRTCGGASLCTPPHAATTNPIIAAAVNSVGGFRFTMNLTVQANNQIRRLCP